LPAYLAWNRFGEILEKRGDLRGALEAYRKSLEIEWNQPPTLEARRRLEAAVK
jgi:predicted TPR repeat methyltransferase